MMLFLHARAEAAEGCKAASVAAARACAASTVSSSAADSPEGSRSFRALLLCVGGSGMRVSHLCYPPGLSARCSLAEGRVGGSQTLQSLFSGTGRRR